MITQNLITSRLFLQSATVVVGLLAANFAIAADMKDATCICDRGIESKDISGLVAKWELPKDVTPTSQEEKAMTPQSLGAKKDANSFVYPIYLHEGVYYVRLGHELALPRGSWGPSGGVVTVASGETCVAGAARKFREENAAGLHISPETLAEYSHIIPTKNYFGLLEVLYFTRMTSLIPQEHEEHAVASFHEVRANKEKSPCITEENDPKKTCVFSVADDHVWVAFADLYENFYRKDGRNEYKYPYYVDSDSADKTVAGDQEVEVRILIMNVDGSIEIINRRLNIRRNATPSHFRNVTHAIENQNLGDEHEEFLRKHAEDASIFFQYLVGGEGASAEI